MEILKFIKILMIKNLRLADSGRTTAFHRHLQKYLRSKPRCLTTQAEPNFVCSIKPDKQNTSLSNRCNWYRRRETFDWGQNHAVVLHNPNDLRLEQRSVPNISNFEVLVAMDTVSVNRLDLDFVTKGKYGPFKMNQPTIIGQDGTGIVAKVGKCVNNLKEGDRIAIEPGYPCARCKFCKAGLQNICPSIKFCVSAPYDGNLSQFYKYAGDYCVKIPNQITMEEGALLTPLSWAAAACRRAKIKEDSRLLIIGAGPMGLLSLLTAQFFGANDIFVVDLNQDRLNVALQLGASNTILTTPNICPRKLAKQVEENLGSRFDKAIDTAGTDATTKFAVCATKVGGTVVLLGLANSNVKLPNIDALSRKISIFGTNRTRNDFKTALEMLILGNFNIKRLITHHYNIMESQKAFEVLQNTDKSCAIKVQIHIQPPDKNNPVPYASNNEFYANK